MIRSDYRMSTLPGPLRLTPAFAFAGRARELGALTALLPRADGEGRRAALVSGEPGSGKSRLVRELAGRLAVEGALVLYGACDAVVPAPYGPFVEALDRFVRQTDVDELRADLGPSGGELTRLLPDLSSVVGGLPPPLAADADAERHRLHTAIVELLASLGARAPVLLVLEDVHWADATTLHVVRHLARAGADARMLLVVTFRDAEADMPAELAETLVDVARSEGVVRVRLGGLSDDDVGEFVRNATGAEAGPEVREAIGSLTDGNAFLLTELWRELVDSQAIEVRAGTVRLARPVADIGTPETVREVVTQRLARLGPITGQVLELAAVVGAEFELQTVRRAAALPEGQLLDAIDDVVRSGLVVEAPGLRLAYRFAHELVRRAVADRLSAARRAEIHLRVAEALETQPAAGETRSRRATLAYHFTEAAAAGAVERAVTYNLLAAESAAAALAFDEAAERLRTALALGIDDPRERGQARLRLGYACHRGGRATDALAAFRDTASLARELEDAELLARAAIGFEESCWRPGIHGEGSIELLEEAARSIGTEPSELRVRLLGALARALDFTGAYARAAVARDEAITMARSRGDRAALGWVLSASYWSRGVTSNDEINRMLTEALEIGEELGDVAIRTEALAWLVPSYVALCDHAAAHEALNRHFDLARRLHEPFHLHVADHYASALALCDGDLAGAEAAALRSHEWSRLLTGRDASGTHGIQMFGIRREQGRLAELAPVVRVLATGDRAGAWAPGLAVVLAALGMEDEARRELGRLRSAGLGSLRESLWLAGLTYLADACSQLGDEATAAVVYPELEPYQGSNVQVGHLVSCYGAADRYLGMLATVLGDWDRAEAHFESALRLNRDLGARTWLAHTSHEYGRMLLARGRPDDRSAASSLLREGLALATEIGMPALQARVGALGTVADGTPAWPDGLSTREVEILRLVSRGLSNREIGAELFISEHTAANHMRSILRKTACANRTEAAAYAHRRGLVTA
jgi:DNA-binding CsgD family transcriptional regulator/tetratricopeptide (TPR) repeat protein